MQSEDPEYPTMVLDREKWEFQMKTSSSLLRKRPIAIVIGVAAMILVTSPLTEPAQQHLAGHYYHGQSGHSSSGLLKLAYGNLCYDGGRAIVC